MEVPDKLKLKIIDSRVFDFKRAIEYMREGKSIAEIKNDRPERVYCWDKEFFMINLHLGTFIQTSTFEMFTNMDYERKFVLVELETNKEEIEQRKIKVLPDKKVEKIPMFFETDDRLLINIFSITKCFKTHTGSYNLIFTGNDTTDIYLSKSEELRFKRFAELHGIFGKDN